MSPLLRFTLLLRRARSAARCDARLLCASACWHTSSAQVPCKYPGSNSPSLQFIVLWFTTAPRPTVGAVHR
ncbi:hypothetical protein B0H10DRAFT_720373 [Mycena sp. CBHHK59/15]|nr:hypothetical protein B0H10DRAFT_720373 [Mycena sp. CBHHK59/15]